jgi:hypothetical protein
MPPLKRATKTASATPRSKKKTTTPSRRRLDRLPLFSPVVATNIMTSILESMARGGTSAQQLGDIVNSGKLQEAFAAVLRRERGEMTLAGFLKRAPSMLKKRRKQHDDFRERLARSWERPFDLLETLTVVAIESGQEMSRAWRWRRNAEQDLVFDIVRRLHARGCQVAGEVLQLLQAGYPAGAHARWRALHETTVTAIFISEKGADVAMRYTAHEAVQAHKSALGIQKYASRLGMRPLTSRQMKAVEDRHTAVVAQHSGTISPRSFAGEYGWAAEALSNPRPTFADLEAAVALDHWRPYYKLASQPVHAGVRSFTHSLAIPDNSKLIHTGPSNIGMTTPGDSTALSLQLLTVTLLNLQPSVDGITISRAMGLLTRRIAEAFLQAESQLELKVKAMRVRGRRRRSLTSATGT